ncbi:hypothetical protein VTP01DRAFT_10508 [Rhizomucor pusillus]|uniref:uncharacterized protein n=1 Tax=Rhizomucor pusillus TaxID=4840 RepID=UPI003744030A
MEDLFKGVRIYILPVKIEPYTVEATKKLLEKHGGEYCASQDKATMIATSLKSASRIQRHLENRKIPVVDINWIKDSIKQQCKLPLDNYVIVKKMKTTQAGKPEHINQPSDLLTKPFAERTPQLMPRFPEDEEDEAAQDTDEDFDNELAPDFVNSKYECFRPTPLKPYHNQKLVYLLRLLERQRELDMEDKNALSYRHTIAAIKAYPRRIRSAEEASKIIGVGKKMTELVRTYLSTGTIPEAEKLLTDEKFNTLSLFCKVFGVGVATARIWWDSGYRTLQEVLENAKLTNTVRLCIELLPDLIQPMSRQDIEELVEIIRHELTKVDDQAFVTPVGGYRRGKEENGDLDIVISSRNTKLDTDHLLSQLVDQLSQSGYVKHKLWYSDPDTKRRGPHDFPKGGGKQAGFDRLDKCFMALLQPSKSILRQVDLIIASLVEYPTAVLGWTGSRQFERALRDYAKREKGLTVTSSGIFDDKADKKQLEVHSEKHAFEITWSVELLIVRRLITSKSYISVIETCQL